MERGKLLDRSGLSPLDLIRKFIYSYAFIAIQLSVAIYSFVTHDTMLTVLFFSIVIGAVLLLMDDFTVLFLPFALAVMVLMDNYGLSPEIVEKNKPLYYSILFALSFMAAAFLAHFIIYRKNHRLRDFKCGKLFFPNIAVALAILLGGVSFGLKNYERAVTIYYVLGLSVVMVLVYFMLKNYVRPYFNLSAGDVLSRQMIGVCLLGFAMMLTVGIRYYEQHNALDWYLSWKNGFSTMLLIAMPFAFYLSTRSRLGLVYWMIGIMAYGAMFFSYSRGGILFGTIEVIACVIASAVLSKSYNRLILIAAGAALIALAAYTIFSSEEILMRLKSLVDVDPNEARVHLYNEAVENFLKYPIFGAGLGYVGAHFEPRPASLYWVHSTFFQVIGSMGVVGLLAYGYQFAARIKVFFNKNSIINAFMLISFLGYYGYQMVDACEFIPIPWMPIIAMLFVTAEHGNADSGVKTVKYDKITNKQMKYYNGNRFI